MVLIFCVCDFISSNFAKLFCIPVISVVDSVGSLTCGIMSSMCRDNLNSSFPVSIPPVFSTLMALEKSFQNSVIGNGQSGHPCLVPNLS